MIPLRRVKDSLKPRRPPLRLFDPRRGDLSFKVEAIGGAEFTHAQRFNYFTVLFIERGDGSFDADLLRGVFDGPALLFFNPYQTFRLTPALAIAGTALQFHANFFCIETHHEAVGCNGVLFNEIYGQPVVRLRSKDANEFRELIRKMENEMRAAALAHSELLVSYLKIFLIQATRLKVDQQHVRADAPAAAGVPPELRQLVELIETHYQDMHRPSEYARVLHMAPKTLGQLVKTHFGRTLTDLIRERLIKHAKWQLLHTVRPVKEIAHEVGFDDEFYFSRVFQRATGCSPTAFRDFETAIRGGRNLSM